MQELVNSALTSLPIVVVIDDHASANNQVRKHSLKAACDWVMPVNVNVSERHGTGHNQLILDQAFHETDVVGLLMNPEAPQIVTNQGEKIDLISVVLVPAYSR